MTNRDQRNPPDSRHDVDRRIRLTPFWTVWNAVVRGTLCKVGLHTRPTGHGLDACARGCGFVRRPEAALPYVVRLKDGTTHRVRAINAYHAASLVVYGGMPQLTADGRLPSEVKVHRDNIASVELEACEPSGASPLRD